MGGFGYFCSLNCLFMPCMPAVEQKQSQTALSYLSKILTQIPRSTDPGWRNQSEEEHLFTGFLLGDRFDPDAENMHFHNHIVRHGNTCYAQCAPSRHSASDKLIVYHLFKEDIGSKNQKR